MKFIFFEVYVLSLDLKLKLKSRYWLISGAFHKLYARLVLSPTDDHKRWFIIVSGP